jgi:aminopeptidase
MRTQQFSCDETKATTKRCIQRRQNSHIHGQESNVADLRWNDLAGQLIAGTSVVEGSAVAIFMTDVSVMPAVEAFVAECYRIGALPQVIAADERFDRLAVEFASEAVLSSAAPLELASMEWADVHVSFRGMVAPASGLDEARVALQRAGKGAVSTARWQHTRWCLVRVPTPEWAELAGVNYEPLLDEFFGGCLADWGTLKPRWDDLCAELSSASTVRIISSDTDISFGVAGRSWISFSGEANLPDGEIATAPLDDRVDGHITFPGTFWFAGVAVTDLRLEFSEGVVTTSHATAGAEFVERLLSTDAGARRVGELGIGTNALMRTLTGDLLIDEKILGTAHLALGRAYPDCGGVNESSLHWDIVKDLRAPGSFLTVDEVRLIADGVVVGKFADATAL